MINDTNTLILERNDLDDIPRFPLNQPYRIRTYQPGDEIHWYKIHLQADRLSNITEKLFCSQFGSDLEELSKRQFYLCNSDEVIGTASAWHDKNYKNGSYGRVHWVAIKPSYQRLGLSKPLLSEVLQALARLAHEKAYVSTSRLRPVAIRLYKSFGFVEVLGTQSPNQRIQRTRAPLI